ncbi:NAD(P)/FAD-dependent oxidoreductase [Trinickia sp. NRRL B-1857]|uniref:flavin monoamine oxidase family protein n=1 Tax=Trinickia sp. NRRL B-1857 TaxID=3162879 RepID=UPI003D2BBB87
MHKDDRQNPASSSEDAQQPRANRRREFLENLGRVAGAGATYAAMTGLGLLNVPAHASGRSTLLPHVDDLSDQVGKGHSVAIVGAGITGLTLAYELSRLGFSVTVLEASARPGGRSHTVRGGDRLQEYGGVQEVRWDKEPHLYANMGPARIPYHHQTIIGYCKAFGVPLEVFVNENRGALIYESRAFGGNPVENRYFVHSTRGWVSELLAKAVNRQALDDVLSNEDKEKLLVMLKGYGELDAQYQYPGASRAGYRVTPGAGLVAGELNPRASLHDLLSSEFAKSNLSFTEEWNQAATMLQPVGGMDRIVQAFVKRVGQHIRYDSPVTSLRKLGDRARVTYRSQGEERALEVDFAIATVPFPAFAKVPNDFSPAHQAAMQSCHYTQAAKVAFQADRRFWEEDLHIYGGISWTDQDIGQMWYPSGALMGRKGIVMGAYIRDDSVGTRYAAMSFPERIEGALQCGEQIHPRYRNEVKQGVSVCWPQVPYADGGWAVWSDAARAEHYPVLTRPDGALYLAGDQISYLPGWQEGSVLSAHAVAAALVERVSARAAA